MAQIDDLTAALATAQTDLNTLATDVANGIKVLTQAIQAAQAANPTVDLSAAIAAANALDTSIKSVDTTVVSATSTPTA